MKYNLVILILIIIKKKKKKKKKKTTGDIKYTDKRLLNSEALVCTEVYY